MPGPIGWFSQLEPLAQDCLTSGQIHDAQHVIDLSQAISLKRIADALNSPSLDLGIMTGNIQNIAWEAGRSFQAGTRTDR